MPSSRILARELRDERADTFDAFDQPFERRRSGARSEAAEPEAPRMTTARRTAPLTAGALLLASALTLVMAPVAEAVGHLVGH